MADIIAKLLGAIQLVTTKHIFIVFMLAVAVLVLPTIVLDTLGITNLVNQYRSYIGITVLVSSVILLVNMIPSLFQKARDKAKRSDIEKQKIKCIQDLDDNEKKLLIEYFILPYRKFSYIPLDNNTLRKLMQKGVLYANASHSIIASEIYIDDWYFDYICKNIKITQK